MTTHIKDLVWLDSIAQYPELSAVVIPQIIQMAEGFGICTSDDCWDARNSEPTIFNGNTHRLKFECDSCGFTNK